MKKLNIDSKHNIMILSGSLTGGGAERVAVNLADGLARLGHHITLVCEQRGEITYKPSDNVNLQFYPQVSNKRYITILEYAWNIRGMIKQIRPDVIIGIGTGNSLRGKIAQMLSLKRIPVILSDHYTLDSPSCAPFSKTERFLKFYFSRICEAYTVLTHADKVFGESKGLKNIVVMPNPLELSPAVEGYTKDKVILAVGRLNAWHCKGFDILVRAWETLAHKYPDWQLQIAGMGSEMDKERILSFLEDKSVRNRITFLGYTKDVVKHYQRSAIFVLSSRYEGFGLVITEAMSQMCACVATDYKGRQSEIITDGVDGLLCTPENIDDLAQKMEMLITDNELRKKIQNNATLNLKRFHPDVYAKMWDSLISQQFNN